MKLRRVLAIVSASALALCGMAYAGGTPAGFTGYGSFDRYQFDMSPCTAFGQPGATQINTVSAASVNAVVEAYGFDPYDEYNSTDPWDFTMDATIWLTAGGSPVTVEIDTHHGPACTNTCLGNGNCKNATWSNCINEVDPPVTIPAGATVQLQAHTLDAGEANSAYVNGAWNAAPYLMVDNTYGNSYVTFKPMGGSVTCNKVDWTQEGFDDVPGNF
jgi:hypothetical protein